MNVAVVAIDFASKKLEKRKLLQLPVENLGQARSCKVLPANFMSDPDRKRRFIQEARATSALNHPNIITVHDIGNEDGVDFIVMEYVEGKTLDLRIPSKGMKVNEALTLAIQIADALAKAHSAGIIHRDLKPSNVMVTEDGVVKVLDFGLAKLAEVGHNEGETRTLESLTEEGMIIGTVSYMSPEQAMGIELDARTDLFSFGVVIYQMATGKLPFTGSTSALIFHAILSQALGRNGFGRVEWSPDGHRLAYIKTQETPGGSEVSIEGCDLQGRSQVTVLPKADLVDFCWLPDGRMICSLVEPDTNEQSCNLWEIPIDVGTGKSKGNPRRLTNWAGFCMDSIGTTADGRRLAFRRWTYEAGVYVADVDAKGSRITTPKRLAQSDASDVPTAWTADSKTILFSSSRGGAGHSSVFKQGLNEDTAEPLVTGTEDARFPKLSPDGAWVLFFGGTTHYDPSNPMVRLMRVSVTGGSPEQVLTYRASWTDRCAISPATLCVISEPASDRKQIIFISFDPIKGRGRELIRLAVEPEFTYAWDLSPDGTRIAVLKISEGRLQILSLLGQPPQEVFVKGWNSGDALDWAPDGKGLYVSNLTQRGIELMHVDLRGNVHVLWEQPGGTEIWGIPSPDGHHLAMLGSAQNSNIWMIENF